MATVFWISQSVIYIDYLGKAATGSNLPNYCADRMANRERKTTVFGEEKSAIPPGQRTGSHLRLRHEKIAKMFE